VPTPFAAIAFEPLDGWSQSLPIHAFIFLVPFHKKLYLASFILIQLWTISIHDEHFVLLEPLNRVFLSSAHHAHHHYKFTANHGLYFTFMDRIGGTYVPPDYEPVSSLKEVLLKRELAGAAVETAEAAAARDPNLFSKEELSRKRA